MFFINQVFLDQSLMKAVCKNNIDEVSSLLARGANANTTVSLHFHRTTLLITAAQYGYEKITDLLLADKADVNACDTNKCTALMYAVWHRHTTIVQKLLDHKANIDAADCTGATALARTAYRGYPELAALLLAHGADASIANKDGWTAAMWADKRSDPEVAQTIRWNQLRSAWVGVVCKAQEQLDVD